MLLDILNVVYQKMYILQIGISSFHCSTEIALNQRILKNPPIFIVSFSLIERYTILGGAFNKLPA